MQRKIIVLTRPEIDWDRPEERVLAEGIRVVWACALYAGGADLFIPEATEGDLDSWVSPPRGRHMTHDRQPLSRSADALVTSRFVRGPDSLRISVFVDRPGRPTVMRGGCTFRGGTAELRSMETTLHTIAHAVGVDVPREVGWRELTVTRSGPAGLAHLLAAGREVLPDPGEPRAHVH
jgi:hypothetical protein